MKSYKYSVSYLRNHIFLLFCLFILSCDNEQNNKENENVGLVITVAENSLKLPRDGEVELNFSVSPMDALFNYSIGSDSCQVEVKLLGNNQSEADFILKEIKSKLSAQGTPLPGEYVAIIKERNNSQIHYCQEACLSIKNCGTGGGNIFSSNPFVISSSNNGVRLSKVSISDGKKDYLPFFNIDSLNYVICLPKEVFTNNLELNVRHDGLYIEVNGKKISSMENVNYDEPLDLVVCADTGKRKKYTVRVYPCDLPAISIITKECTPITSKEIWYDGATISIWNTDCTVTEAQDLKIRCRGNASMRFPKKSYAIKLSKKNDLLGMPADKRWDLQSNWRDRTNMRNNIAFCLARQCSGLEWTPRMEYCELFIDGQHLGLYALMEHIKIAKNRVNVDELKNTDTLEEQITGGYLMEIDSYYDNDLKFRSSIMDLPYMIKEPEGDECLAIHLDYIKNYINVLEDNLYSDSFKEKYNSFIDIDSFIDWWIIYELTGNDEPQRPHSCYVYKKRGGLLYAGPVWDFDWPSFMPDQIDWKIKGCMYYGRLFEDPQFLERVKKRWKEHKQKFENVCNVVIENEAKKIQFSEKRDTEYWPIEDEIALFFNGDESLSFKEAVERMKLALNQRICWMEESISSL